MQSYISIVSLFIAFLSQSDTTCISPVSHKCLVEELLANYGPRCTRPVKKYNQTVEVQNERDQLLKFMAMLNLQWKDEFLTWNIIRHPEIDKLYVQNNDIWLPDIFMTEEIQSDQHDDTKLVVSPDGTVFWARQIYYTASCKIHARFFPFDTQNCSLTFSSWAHDSTKLNITISPNRNDRLIYTDNGVWDLNYVQTERYVRVFDSHPGHYPSVQISLILTRRSLFYVLVIIVPCTLLSLINLMVFVLPTESGEQVSLGITNFLALVLVQQLIGEFIPPAADEFPVISSYYFTPMILTGCLSVVSGILTAYMHHHQSLYQIPGWLCKLASLKTSKKRRQNLGLYDYDVKPKNAPSCDHNPSTQLTTQIIEDDVKDDDHGEKIDGNRSDGENSIPFNGKEMAAILNRILMITCVLVTLCSMLITVVMFISN